METEWQRRRWRRSRSDFEAIDRLEQKLKQLVTVLDSNGPRDRGRRARTTRTRGCAPSSTRARARLAEAEGRGRRAHRAAQEREQIRGRVDDMLKQIEALNL